MRRGFEEFVKQFVPDEIRTFSAGGMGLFCCAALFKLLLNHQIVIAPIFGKRPVEDSDVSLHLFAIFSTRAINILTKFWRTIPCSSWVKRPYHAISQNTQSLLSTTTQSKLTKSGPGLVTTTSWDATNSNSDVFSIQRSG